MSFTSPVFLFAFLPLTVIVYQLARSTKLKNAVWIAAGLLFYAFGDLRHLPLLLGSCLLHYGAGRYLMAQKKARRAVLLSCVALDLAVLAGPSKTISPARIPMTRSQYLSARSTW